MTLTLSTIERYCSLTEQTFDCAWREDLTIESEAFMFDGSTIQVSTMSGLRNSINLWNKTSKSTLGWKSGAHSPSFKIRGVIEGFYGNPWSHEQRKRGLIHFAKCNMNTFVFAPKDDPWQRFDWRTPFSEAFLHSTQELCELARDLCIEMSVCVSPGLTIQYSSQEDVDALLVRYRQLHEIGIRRFGLLLDDIPGELQFEQDRKNFQTLAQAHAELANRVNRALKEIDSENSLFVCPLQYHGRGHEPYISELGYKLQPEVDLMWTGRQICSEYLEEVDAKYFHSQTSKAPFYWDNYPVNDVAMVHQLHIGPIAKRDKNLGEFSVGLVANPMDRFEASLIPLTTIADYLWDSRNYSPENSWEQALNLFVTKERDRNALRHLFRNCFESCLAVDPAPDFGAMLGSITLSWRIGNLNLAISTLQDWSDSILENYSIITAPDFSWVLLRNEIGPWLEKYHNVGRALKEVAHVLSRAKSVDGRLQGTSELSQEIRKIRNSLAQDPTRIFGDGLDLVLGELATELSVAKS